EHEREFAESGFRRHDRHESKFIKYFKRKTITVKQREPMEEEIKFVLDSAREAMGNAIRHLEKQLVNIRAGKASPAMVSNVMINYYGSPTPLSQVANVSTPDGMTITIQPWEKSLIPEIEKGIHQANIG